MNRMIWSPWREFDDVFDRYQRMLQRNQRDSQRREDSVVEWRPTANISETDDAYVIRAELPEVDKENVEITVQDGLITIAGERQLRKVHDSERHHRLESFYGRFSRSFNLPADVDEAAITAECRDGVLAVNLPKREAARPRSIEVKVGG